MIRKVAQPIGCMIYIYIYYLHFVDLWEMQQVHVKGCFCQGFQSIIQGDHLTSNDSILTSPRVTKGRRPVGYGADLYRFVLQFTCIYIYYFLCLYISGMVSLKTMFLSPSISDRSSESLFGKNFGVLTSHSSTFSPQFQPYVII